MEQRDRRALEKHNSNFLERLEVSTRYPAEVINLIRSDLEFGLTEAQVQQYYKKPWEIQKMRVYSKCLRSGFSEEAIAVITTEKLTWQQMEVAFEFYDRCVPLETIEKVVTENDSAFTMRKALSSYLRTLKSAKESVDVAPEYVQGLFSHMEEGISKIIATQEHYEVLNKKLDELQTEKKDQEAEQRLLKENSELNKLIVEQQNRVNQADKKIAELRNQLEKKEEEVKVLEKKIVELTEENQSKDAQMADMAGKVEKMKSVVEVASRVQQETVTPKEVEIKNVTQPEADSFAPSQTIPGAVPVYYQIPVMDNGKVVDRVTMERTERKTGGVAAILGKLCFKRKSRQDIVRLVASGDLEPGQLEQIKIGMEKGLTEKQLEQLINNNLSPERMAKVIAIAELDNKMND